MMKKYAYFLCVVIFILSLGLLGCSRDEAKDNLTSLLKENKVEGEIVASTSMKNKGGYVGWVRLKNGKSAVAVIDTKNNQRALITTDANRDFNKDFNEKLFLPLEYPGISEYNKFNVTIYDDSVDQDNTIGKWDGKNHIVTVYANYTYDNEKGIIPGSLTLYDDRKGYIRDSKRLELVNMLVKSLTEFYEPVMGVSIKEGQEQHVKASVREELEPFLKEHNVGGTIIAHTSEKDERGYVAWVQVKNPKGVVDTAVIIDKRNNQKAIIELRNETSQLFVPMKHLGRNGLAILPVMIYDDRMDRDREYGAWYGKNHLIPVYALYEYNKGQGVIPGRLTSGVGSHPSHYQGPLYEQKNVDLVNLFLMSLPEFYEPIMGEPL